MHVAVAAAVAPMRSAPTGAGEEVAGAAGMLAPHRSVLPRHSADARVFVSSGEEAVRRTNDPTARPPDSGRHVSEPIIRSLFDPHRTRHPSQAYTLYPAYPDGAGWQEDRFYVRKIIHVPGADAPRGEFRDWAAVRRNIGRSYPETYGEQVALSEEGEL